MVFVDVDLGEERLVEQALNVIRRCQVGGVTVPGEIKRLGQHCLGSVVVRIGGGQLLLDPSELAANLVLFGLELVERDRPCVVGVEQFLALSQLLDALALKLTVRGLRCYVELVEVVGDIRLELVAKLWFERDGAVLILEQFLDGRRGHGLSLAGGGLPLAA